jgi:ubiquinone/menaquinone biosynthesis C-methylase UbiE
MAMGFYEKHIVPRIINLACGTEMIREQREKVVPLAEGTVLEIGIGPGFNLPLYDAGKVSRVIGLDPSETSWKFAAERIKAAQFPVEFIGLPGEQIPLADQSVDTVLVTYSLCTIPDPHTALQGMRRVLKDGGKLIFCEHGRAPDAHVCKWQDRINPIWKPLFGGCNLNRKIPDIIERAGFRIPQLEAAYLPDTPRFAAYTYWGIAKKG